MFVFDYSGAPVQPDQERSGFPKSLVSPLRWVLWTVGTYLYGRAHLWRSSVGRFVLVEIGLLQMLSRREHGLGKGFERSQGEKSTLLILPHK